MQWSDRFLFSWTLLPGLIALSLSLLLSFSLVRGGAGLFSQVSVRTYAFATTFLPAGARPSGGGPLSGLLDLLGDLKGNWGGA